MTVERFVTEAKERVGGGGGWRGGVVSRNLAARNLRPQDPLDVLKTQTRKTFLENSVFHGLLQHLSRSVLTVRW